jgi:hypothetical protein
MVTTAITLTGVRVVAPLEREGTLVEVEGGLGDGRLELVVEPPILRPGVQAVRGYAEHAEADRDEQDEARHHARPQRHSRSGWHDRASVTFITVWAAPQRLLGSCWEVAGND